MTRALGLALVVLFLVCPAFAKDKPSKSRSGKCLQIEAGTTTASGCRYWQTATPTGTIWQIDEPVVDQPRSEYPAITFQKFDEIVVMGGGCVQTGGSGRTWKRYIDPSGDNSDRLYHARIWIPGATAGFVRLSSIAPTKDQFADTDASSPPVHLFVNYSPPHADPGEIKPYHLYLGYEDDYYHDNGYYDHDDGKDNQCYSLYSPTYKHEQPGLKDQDPGRNGLAWLSIEIIHHPTAQTVPNPVAPLDLWWDQVDDNFLPNNPDWWVHHNSSTGELPNSNSRDQCNSFREGTHDRFLSGRDPKCTMADPDVDESNTLTSFCHFLRPFSDAVHGHVNWAVATYQGRIFFATANIGKAGYGPGDGDYDWWLEPEDNQGKRIDNGISQGDVADGRTAIALEFSSRETVDKIKKPKTWWNDFHHAVDSGPALQACTPLGSPKSPANCMVDGRPAIVIGLLGFDNEHGDRGGGARVELHPVYGLAIKIADRASGSPQDVWAIMARNWGNEGSCSNGWDITHGKWQHYLGLADNKMQFFIPAKLSAGAATQWISSDLATARILDGGLLVTIQLPEPEKEKLFWGELHITSP